MIVERVRRQSRLNAWIKIHNFQKIIHARWKGNFFNKLLRNFQTKFISFLNVFWNLLWKILPFKIPQRIKTFYIDFDFFDVICRLSSLSKWIVSLKLKIEILNKHYVTWRDWSILNIIFYWIKSILKTHVTTSADVWVKIETCSSVSHISGSSAWRLIKLINKEQKIEFGSYWLRENPKASTKNHFVVMLNLKFVQPIITKLYELKLYNYSREDDWREGIQCSHNLTFEEQKDWEFSSHY